MTDKQQGVLIRAKNLASKVASNNSENYREDAYSIYQALQQFIDDAPNTREERFKNGVGGINYNRFNAKAAKHLNDGVRDE